MAAQVQGPERVILDLNPTTPGMIGRALIRRGEIVFYIEVEAGHARLRVASDHDVTGTVQDHKYRITMTGPSNVTSLREVHPDQVIHIRYAQDVREPWDGIGPLQSALIGGRLNAETAQALALESLGSQLANLKGQTTFIETTATGWGTGDTRTAPRRDWMASRLGANPPDALVALHQVATAEILAACGVPPELVSGGQGTSQRETWRRFLFGTVAPLGRVIEAELHMKLDPTIRITWDELRASDLQGRARAYGSMVGAGINPDVAARLAGLDLSSE